MTNRLEEIQKKLLTESNRRRDQGINEIDAYARGYTSGMFDTLAEFEAAEQAQPVSEQRANLDRIRGMTPQELVVLLDRFAGGCQTCPAHDFCHDDKSETCVESMMGWLESEC